LRDKEDEHILVMEEKNNLQTFFEELKIQHAEEVSKGQSLEVELSNVKEESEKILETMKTDLMQEFQDS
jgi:hypothetical protein